MASRIKFEEVKESVEQNGWKLLSETYHNLKADLIACCPKVMKIILHMKTGEKARLYVKFVTRL